MTVFQINKSKLKDIKSIGIIEVTLVGGFNFMLTKVFDLYKIKIRGRCCVGIIYSSEVVSNEGLEYK